MLQRVTDLIDYGTVKFCIFTCHVQFHLLVQLSGKITDHTREFCNYTLDWHHPDFHHGLMKIGRDTLQIFNLLMEGLVLEISGIGGADRHQTVLCDDKLGYLVHQCIQLLNIYTDSTVCDRLCNRLLFIAAALCLRCRLYCLCLWLLLCRCRLSRCILGLFCRRSVRFRFLLLCSQRLVFYFLTDNLINLRYRLCSFRNLLIRLVRRNKNAEIAVELLILNILGARIVYKDLSKLFHCLEYQECSRCL